MATELKFGLSAEIIKDFQIVFALHPQVEKVLIFGSRAKDNWKDGSDIDLAIFGSHLTDTDFTKLWSEIDDLPLVFKVDCIHWDKLANLQLKEKILQEGKTFYPLTNF